MEKSLLALAVDLTKTERAQWFQEGPLLLPSRPPEGVRASNGGDRRTAKVLKEAREFTRSFLTEWVTTEKLDDLLKRMDAVVVTESTGLSSLADGAFLSRTVLAAWRMRDHGLMVELGHASAEPMNKAVQAKLKKSTEEPKSLFFRLAKASQDPKAQVRYESLEKATMSFGKEPFLVVPLEPGKFAVLVQFKHTPNDVVVRELSLRGNDFGVTSVKWLIEP